MIIPLCVLNFADKGPYSQWKVEMLVAQSCLAVCDHGL